ncbi:MAG: FMN-binding protein [Clostridia bacterium]|nr:FMN-binding protein [Clostridia bacterium]
MKNYIKSIISLTVIFAVVVAALAATNTITAPIIEKNAGAAANEALLVVMPDGGEFTAADLTQYTLPESVLEAFTASNGGAVVKLTATGYGPDMIIMCGVDANGNVTGTVCLSSNETLGVEKTYGDTLKGATIDTIDGIATVSGATMTTGAYKSAVKDAINTATILGGGSADIRSPEEILADNLATALPTGDKFNEVFICEKLENISAIYEAENGAGFVYVTKAGEEEIFVGVDADGAVVSEATDDVKATVEAAAKIMLKSTLKEVDITKYADMPSNVDKAYKTKSGNYVLEIHASGFGINGDHYYNPSGEYIYIKLAITKDGEIISCQTTKQSETDGVGSICADKEFSAQYVGKNESTYKEIDTVAGVTLTTKGYQNGIGKAIEAVKIMEGVA